MPNWCLNRLDVEGVKSSIDDLIAHIGSADDVFDFTRVSPPPPSLLEQPSEEEHAEQSDSSSPSVFDWLAENWGTSSNALDQRMTREADDLCVFRFDTAWAPPIPLIKKLSSSYPQLTFALRFDEPWGGYAGGAFFERGEMTADLRYRRAFETAPSVLAMQFCVRQAIDGLEHAIAGPSFKPVRTHEEPTSDQDWSAEL